MGVLPSRRASATSVSIVASLVCSPRITSTSSIRWAGWKKCIPANRSGCDHEPAIREIGIVEVLLATIAVLPSNPARARNISVLSCSSSVTASMTTSQPARIVDISGRDQRRVFRPARRVQPPVSPSPRSAGRGSRQLPAWPDSRSTSAVAIPARTSDPGDSRSHLAGAQNAGAVDGKRLQNAAKQVDAIRCSRQWPLRSGA